MIPTERANDPPRTNGHRFSAAGHPGLASDIELPETLIRPRTGWVAVDWNELLHNRELLYFFAWRDIKVRYKQTVLGVVWAVLQPLLTLLIFTVVFGMFVRVPTGEVPYPVFAFAGLIPWMFFSQGLAYSSQSLLNQQHLLTKIYFPRLFIPTAAIGAFFVDMAISFVLYAGIMALYGVIPSWQSVFVPALVALMVVATLGAGYALAALTALYRDFRAIVPFLIQILMYLSPVIYPARLIPHRLRLILALNPMCGIIDAFRSAILGGPWDLDILAISAVSSLCLFVLGLYYFRKVERLVVDIV